MPAPEAGVWRLPVMATAAGGTHPTGMHSCFIFAYIIWHIPGRTANVLEYKVGITVNISNFVCLLKTRMGRLILVAQIIYLFDFAFGFEQIHLSLFDTIFLYWIDRNCPVYLETALIIP